MIDSWQISNSQLHLCFITTQYFNYIIVNNKEGIHLY